MEELSLIVVGSLSTDIFASGIPSFPGEGGQVRGEFCRIAPGGKSRNIADMAARLLDPGRVAMVGRTVKDRFGLWKVPVDALTEVGVRVDAVRVSDGGTDAMPFIAIIPVDTEGRNRIMILPGGSDDFSPQDIEDARDLFAEAGRHSGYLALTLECPKETAERAVELAVAHGLRVMLDPGGISDPSQVEALLPHVDILKPNEHETLLLTGITVASTDDARRAGDVLLDRGVENVVITLGSAGGYLVNRNEVRHFPAPEVAPTGERDETGCGDQAGAAMLAGLVEGMTIEEACERGIRAGTLQFHRAGIIPLSRSDLEKGSVAR